MHPLMASGWPCSGPTTPPLSCLCPTSPAVAGLMGTRVEQEAVLRPCCPPLAVWAVWAVWAVQTRPGALTACPPSSRSCSTCEGALVEPRPLRPSEPYSPYVPLPSCVCYVREFFVCVVVRFSRGNAVQSVRTTHSCPRIKKILSVSLSTAIVCAIQPMLWSRSACGSNGPAQPVVRIALTTSVILCWIVGVAQGAYLPTQADPDTRVTGLVRRSWLIQHKCSFACPLRVHATCDASVCTLYKYMHFARQQHSGDFSTHSPLSMPLAVATYHSRKSPPTRVKPPCGYRRTPCSV